LLGHLLEMLDGNKKHLIAELDLLAIPLLPGTLELAASGWRSSLYPQLEPYLARCDIAPKPEAQRSDKNRDWIIELLLDPQTSGGLLATLAIADAEKLIQQSNHFVCVGKLLQTETDASDQISIRL
jgi:selenide,water dikinase